MIVLGSQAMLSKLDGTRVGRLRMNRADFDVVMTVEEFSSWREENSSYIKRLHPSGGNKFKAIVEKDNRKKQYEIELGLEGTSSLFLLENKKEVCDGVVTGFVGETFSCLSLPYQLLTKRSHLIYPIHFEKNMEDYQVLKQAVGKLEKDENMNTYYTLRFEEGKERNKQRTPKLNVTNEKFFSSKLAVEHYFVHDDIHEMMKHHDVPVYEMMKRDFDSAWCEKDMFFTLPYEYQVQSVQEEAYVIALERYIIPQAGKNPNDHFLCYCDAVKRICTTLCSGFFRDFAIEEYDEVIKKYDPNFVERFKDFVRNGTIVPIEGKEMKEVPLMKV